MWLRRDDRLVELGFWNVKDVTDAREHKVPSRSVDKDKGKLFDAPAAEPCPQAEHSASIGAHDSPDVGFQSKPST